MEACPYINIEKKRKVLNSAVFWDTYHLNFKNAFENVVPKSLYMRLMVLFCPLIEMRKSYNYMVKCDTPWKRDHQC